jgi:hypothetical protein
MDFITFLRELAARASAKPLDPWIAPLRKLRGRKGSDGVERIATDAILDALELPRHERTPEAGKRIKAIMVELGWTPVRTMHVTARGRAARMRGYARIFIAS